MLALVTTPSPRIAHAALFLITSRQTGAILEVSGGESLVDRLA